MLKERFINRLNSDKADVTTTSILLWITFTVVLFTVVGGDLFWIISHKSDRVNDCLSGVQYSFQATDEGGAVCLDSLQ